MFSLKQIDFFLVFILLLIINKLVNLSLLIVSAQLKCASDLDCEWMVSMGVKDLHLLGVEQVSHHVTRQPRVASGHHLSLQLHQQPLWRAAAVHAAPAGAQTHGTLWLHRKFCHYFCN